MKCMSYNPESMGPIQLHMHAHTFDSIYTSNVFILVSIGFVSTATSHLTY